jgi:hypothetical protein
MGQLLRLSEHQLSQKWLAQFRSNEDRAQAAQMLNQLKLVSTREFESGIELALTNLQTKLNATIAVYPVASPFPVGILGYDNFNGGIAKNENNQPREVGRRKQFGSEDRMGHILAKLQERFKRGTGSSSVECVPTLSQLKTQGIRHIVLVDDVCGSGTRIANYWKTIPRRIKSLLSLKRYELWIVLYAITPKGKVALGKAIPNFPSDHLISVLPQADLHEILTPELNSLCLKYAQLLGTESIGMGYRGSACPVIFEHGCPNNLPGILWSKRKGWEALFPNRSIPTEMRSCFDEEGVERALEVLWHTNQPKLALSLLDALNQSAPLTSELALMLTALGLRLRGVFESNLAVRLYMNEASLKKLLNVAISMNLYDGTSKNVTPMGKEFVSRFRSRFSGKSRHPVLGKSPESYYPSQCEGNLLKLGKTGRGNGRSVPMESQ